MIPEHRYDTAIFSGRFDPPHLGHILTISDIAARYDGVIVVILDENRECCSAERAKEIIEKVYVGSRHDVTVTINKIHFAKITEEEYEEVVKRGMLVLWEAVYCSGNEEVIEHFKELGLKHEFIPRSYGELYSGTALRKGLDEVQATI